MDMTVTLAAHPFKTNADLMAACISLGYLDPLSTVLDPTDGKGTWWSGNQMPSVLGHDLELDGVDFRDLPHGDSHFSQAVFDPPYVAVGGRKTSTIGDFNKAYGLTDVPTTPDGLHTLMVDGLCELYRVVAPKGIVLFKCMNYVTSGKYKTQAYDALNVALEMFRLRDEFIMLRRPGPQPPHKRQLHARRNYSHLFVLESRKKK